MSVGSLDFHRPPGGTLAFGDDGGSSIPPADLGFDADIGALDSGLVLGLGHALGFDADIGALDSGIGMVWDANVSRGLVHMVRSHYQDAKPVAAAVATHWQDSAPIIRPVASHWRDASPARATVANAWQDSGRLRVGVGVRYQDGAPARATAAARWQDTERRRAAVAAHWQDGAALRYAAEVRWQEMQRLCALASSRWQDGAGVRRFIVEDGRDATPVASGFASHWQNARKPPPGRSWHEVPPEPPHLCYDLDKLGTLEFGLDKSGLEVLAFWCKDDDGPEPARIIVPIRTVYMVVNELDLRRVDGNIRLPAFTASLRLNKDSTTWSFSATLGRAALPDVRDATVGQPVEVELTVNGAAYRLLIEDVKRDRQFPDLRTNVTGRGKSALLDAPHAPLINFDNRAGARTAQQLMLDALTIGGVPFGWDVDFGLQDWVVPAGAWLHHGSYLSAVSAIAAAAGGYVQPHPTAQTLRILPNYPIAPWDWPAQMVPDIELPAAVLVQEGTHWTPKPIYNQVHLSGELGGVLADVYRDGSARDLPADMVVDPLITDAVVARQRGRAILSDVGGQAVLTFSLPVLPETGLILPGKFLRRVDGPEVLQGYVRSMQMDWSAPRLRQTIEVQTHA